MGFTASACLAIASDSLPKAKLSQGIGYFSLGQAVASAIGPQIGLSLSTRFGYNITFAIGAGVIAVSAILAITMKKPPQHGHKAFKVSLNNMFAIEAIIPAVLQLFLAMAYAAIGYFLVLYAQEERGVTNIGIWFTVNAGFMLITRPLIGKLADKYGIHKVMLPSLVLYGFSLFIISVSSNIYMFLFSAFISACGYGTIMPTIQTLCMKAVTPDRRGVAGNTNYIGTDIGFMFGPILAGIFVTSFGYSAMFRIMILPIVIAIILFIVFYQKIKAISLN
jgi:MFS family permease